MSKLIFKNGETISFEDGDSYEHEVEDILIKQGSYNWHISRDSDRTEICINGTYSNNYPEEEYNQESAELRLVEMIMHDLGLYRYEINKKERRKGFTMH